MSNRDNIKEQSLDESVEKQQSTTQLVKLGKSCEWFYHDYDRSYQERFAGIYKYSKDAISYVSLDGVFLDFNDSLLKLTGYSRKELIENKNYQDITPKEYHEYEARIVERILTTGESFEYEKEYIRKNGTRVPVLLTVFIVKDIDGKTAGLAAIIKDITERKKYENTLRESEERYRTVIENTYDLIVEVSADGRFLYANLNHKEILGYEPSELINRSIFDYIHPDDYHDAQTEFKRALESFSAGQFIYRYKHKNGKWLWLESTGKPFRSPTGKIQVFIASRDITERKIAEKAIKESDEQYKNLFEHVPTGMYRTTPDGRILMANPALIQMLGYSSFDELASHNLEEEGFGSGLSRDKFKNLLEREGEVKGLEYSWIKHDASVIHIYESARAIRGEDGSILYYEGTVEDITERKLLFDQSLKHTEELNTLYDDLNKRNKELEILNAITQAVHQFLDLEEVYKIALDMVIELDNVDMACIYLVDEAKNEALMRGHRNFPEEFIHRAGRIPYPKGVTWKIISTGEILNVKNAEKDPDVGPAGRELGFRSMVGIPIALLGKTIGVIWILGYREYLFTQREVDLFLSIGTQIAIAIVKAKQTEDLQLVNKDLSALNKIAISIHGSLNLQEIYNIANDTILNLTSFDILMIYLVDEDTKEAVLQAHSGLSEDYIKRAGRIPYPKGVTWKVINSGEMVLIDDVQKDTDIGPAGRELGHHTMLIVPIKKAEKTIGSIGFASHRILELSSQEIGTLKTIGGQIGTAIAKACLYEESQKQADELRALYDDLNKRNRELEILNAVTQSVHLSINLEEVYNIALDLVMALENIDMAMIYLVDSDRKEAVLQASRNIPEDYIKRAGCIPYPEGITWKVINSCELLNVKDAQKDPEIGSAGRDLGHHGILGIPITLEGVAIGVIWFFTYKMRQFDSHEIGLLSSIGNQIALAIAKAKLYRELSKKNRYETIISTITRSVHQSINLQDVLNNAIDSMSKNIDRANAIGIYLVEGEEAVLRAQKGFDDSYLRRAGKIPYSKGFTWKTIIEGKPSYVSDVNEDTSIGSAGRKAGIKSYLSMPIRFEGKTVGCVNVNSFEKNAFDKEELKLLGIVSQQIETAINNAQSAELLRLKSVIVGNMAEGVGLARISDNIMVYANPMFEKMFGYNSYELIGKSSLILSPFGDNALKHPEVKKIINCLNKKGIWSGELLNVKKDGTLFWSLASVSTFEHPQHGKVWVGIHTDITERKRAEEQLKYSHEQLRNLATHLQTVREEERTTISREIHDELAQVLTGLNMSLSWLAKKLPVTVEDEISSSQMLEEIEAMSKLVDDTIQMARRIATELRPRILDDLGLISAIEWQMQEFQSRTGIKCKLSSNLNSVSLDQGRSTAIFRIFQEALTNVMRHSGASRVSIILMLKSDHLILEVNDDGKGFCQDETSNLTTLGIIGMRERAIFLGGEVEIMGKQNKGTKVIARIPLKR